VRAVADWRPGASLKVLRARADVLRQIRAFFASRDVLEVETPVLGAAAATDPALCSFHVAYRGPGAPPARRLFLQTSPEFSMKRLLAAGSGDIYQIARVFRDGEAGRWHNPEFTLLEWYRTGFDHRRLMDEVAALVAGLLPDRGGFARFAYAELFERYVGVDPRDVDAATLAQAARRHGIDVSGDLRRAGWLDLLFTHVIEPRLAELDCVFVHGFPAAQASLARLDPSDTRIAERFELYVGGVELANGFHELTDSAEQDLRFSKDNGLRRDRGLPTMPPDHRLVAALGAGMPDCAGVALGVDRLLMLMTGAETIGDVLAFPVARA
jgi:lysyl-tRNA synthetase class 2